MDKVNDSVEMYAFFYLVLQTFSVRHHAPGLQPPVHAKKRFFKCF
jgi:hypothetical protein